MTRNINVSILEDHQGIIDGYLYRLEGNDDISVVAISSFGEELEPMLENNPSDVVILDIEVDTSSSNRNPYPILFTIPKLLQIYPELAIIVITMHNERTLIRNVMKAGASGFILKDDRDTIKELPAVIRTVAGGGIHMSKYAYQMIMKRNSADLSNKLTNRQTEALSLCAAYPESSTAQLAKMMDIANSTMRNLLSSTYLRLDVRNRASAVSKATRLKLITRSVPTPHVELDT